MRSELDSICENNEVRIGVTLFSDCASAVVVGNDFSYRDGEESLLDVLGWDHRTIPDTEQDLGFDVDPLGYKVVLTPRVPGITIGACPTMFNDLVQSIPELVDVRKLKPSDFDWALHPGGATIISGVQNAMHLTENHLRASYEVYMSHGNSSSATFFSVLHQLLKGPGDEHIMGCAFGPGISVEMMVLKRCQLSSSDVSRDGTQSPADTLVAEDVD